MKRTAMAIIMAGLAFGVALLIQAQTGNVEQELIRLETKWVDSAVKHDVTTLDKMITDEFLMTFDGILYTKPELFEYIKSIKEWPSIVTDEWKVRVYGDAAVVMGRNSRKMTSEGKEVTSQDRFTDTWIKRGGRWQCVAAHNSTIPQK
jgi:hypothetical protein